MATGCQLPDRNAAAHRVMNNAKLLRELGFDTIFIHEIEGASERRTEYCGFECYEFPKSDTRIGLVRALFDIARIRSVVERTGGVSALIAYNFPAVGLVRLVQYCNSRDMKCIADVTDWYGTRDQSLAYKVVKGLDTNLRMRVAHRRVHGIIAVSTFLEEYYRQAVPTVRIPPLYDLEDAIWSQVESSPQHGETRLVYAGTPSGEKERLDLIVSAIDNLSKRHPVSLDIVGITAAEYESMYRCRVARGVRGGSDFEPDRVRFHGRVSHSEALDYVKRADYSIVVREPNRVTRAGFPTKFAESIACGTPVIASDTSDVGLFLADGKNGMLVSLCNLEADLEAILLRAESVDVDRSALDFRRYVELMKDFLRRSGVKAPAGVRFP